MRNYFYGDSDLCDCDVREFSGGAEYDGYGGGNGTDFADRRKARTGAAIPSVPTHKEL